MYKFKKWGLLAILFSVSPIIIFIITAIISPLFIDNLIIIIPVFPIMAIIFGAIGIKKKEKFALPIFLLVLLIVCVIIICVLNDLMHLNNENRNVSSVPSAGVYKNEEYGFEIKYPSDWFEDRNYKGPRQRGEILGGILNAKVFSDSRNNFVVLFEMDKNEGSESLYSYAAKIGCFRSSDTDMENNCDEFSKLQKKIQLAGKEAVRQEFTTISGPIIEVYVPLDELSILVIYTFGGSENGKDIKQSFISNFDQMLSTFRFLEEPKEIGVTDIGHCINTDGCKEFEELEGFQEMGKIDLGTVFFPHRANTNYAYYLLNGSPILVSTEISKDEEEKLTVEMKKDLSYSEIENKYPNIWFWGFAPQFIEKKTLPNNNEEFIFEYKFVNGCRICDTEYTTEIGFDFDSNRNFLEIKFLRIIKGETRS